MAYKIYSACSVRLLLSYCTLQLLRVTTLFSFWARSEPESRIGFSRDIISNPGLHGPVDFSLQLYLRSGAEDEIRTRDILLGRQALWPTELLPQIKLTFHWASLRCLSSVSESATLVLDYFSINLLTQVQVMVRITGLEPARVIPNSPSNYRLCQFGYIRIF